MRWGAGGYTRQRTNQGRDETTNRDDDDVTQDGTRRDDQA